MRFQKLLFLALFSFLVFISIPIVSLATEYREVQASEILKQIENGEDIYLENCRIVGEFNLSEIELETVPNPKYNELLESVDFNEEELEYWGINKDLKVIESNITIYNSTFENDLDFSNLLFKKFLSLVEVNFSSSAYFLSTSFGDGADFGGAIFGDVAFYKASFGGDARFYKAIFGGDAIFSEAIFGGDAIFSEAIFGDVAFYKASFGGDARFYKAIFGGDAIFSGAIFGGDADFSEASFDGKDNIHEAYFDGDDNIFEAIFGGDADFEDTSFDGYVAFFEANFGGFANFSGASFGDGVYFEGAIFGDVANFYKASFGVFADFSEAIFGDVAIFSEANFYSDADVYEASFGGKDDVYEAIFEGDVDFSEAILEGDVDFSEASFGVDADFEDTSFGDGVYFLNTEFKTVSLKGVDFKEMQISWDSLENSLVFDGPTYVKLIKNFRDLEQFEDADAAYFQYRKICQAEKSWIPFSNGGSKWWDILMCFTCGYGVKPFRAFGLGGFIVLLFSLIYLGSPNLSWSNVGDADSAQKSATKILLNLIPKIDWPNPGISRLSDNKDSVQKVTFWDSFYFSVVTFSTIGFGDWYPKDSFRKWVMLEGLFGWITLSLFLVTLTNVMIRP